jgi:CheY-like chemotaxis protein
MNHEGASVLVAECHEALRGLIATSLARSGFRVETVSSAAELRARLANGQARPSAIVVDVQRPLGLDALAWLQQALPATPVVAINTFGDGHAERRARALGVAAVLDKPFDLPELCLALRELLAPT